MKEAAGREQSRLTTFDGGEAGGIYRDSTMLLPSWRALDGTKVLSYLAPNLVSLHTLWQVASSHFRQGSAKESGTIIDTFCIAWYIILH